MLLIRRILRWILSVIIAVIVIFCVFYALGLFNQADLETFFKNTKIIIG